MITFYSTNCPKCKVLKNKMEKKGIQFVEITDLDEVMEYGKKNGLRSAPLLDVDGTPFEFSTAVRYVDSM